MMKKAALFNRVERFLDKLSGELFELEAHDPALNMEAVHEAFNDLVIKIDELRKDGGPSSS